MVATSDALAIAGAQGFVIPDPAACYARPFDVLQDTTLTRVEKIEILHRWLTNIMTKQDADGGDKSGQAAAVTKALQFLGAPVKTT
jgi:hypothetical protein